MEGRCCGSLLALHWSVASLLVFAGSVEAGTLSQTVDEPGDCRSFAGGHRHQRIEDPSDVGGGAS